MKNILFSLILFPLTFLGQVSITNQSTFGGNDYDSAADVVNAPDGGYYILSYSRSSSSGSVTVTNFGEVDYVLVKYSESHSIEWQRSYGGSDMDMPTDMFIINNNLFLVGTSNSPVSGNKTAVNLGSNDVWIIKTDLDGNMVWDKTLGGNEADLSRAAIQLDNDNILIAAMSSSGISGNKTSPNVGLFDYWLFEIDENGDYVWENTLGTDQVDHPKDITFFENNIYVTGFSQGGVFGDKTEPLYGFSDYWVVKTDNVGNKIWDRAIGTNDPDLGESHLYINSDSIQVFNSGSNPMSGMRSVPRKGTGDIWRVSLSHDGDLLSQKAYGGNQGEVVRSFLPLNGNLLLLSNSNSDISIDKTDNSKGGWDFWPILLNESGDIIWQETIGADDYDVAGEFVSRTNENILLTLGSRSSVSGDKTSPLYGDLDAWIVELDITSLSSDNLTKEDFTVYPNPFHDNILLTGENLNRVKSVEIIDALGKVVSSEKVSNNFNKSTFSISTEDISSGAYVLKIVTSNGIQSYKVVK